MQFLLFQTGNVYSGEPLMSKQVQCFEHAYTTLIYYFWYFFNQFILRILGVSNEKAGNMQR